MSSRPQLGLCADCVYAQRLRNDRGSEFLLCDKAKTMPELPRYPPLPVGKCVGYRGAVVPPRQAP